MEGKVFLVGAGPGSPDLITVRGLRLLQASDAVVHDRLVDEGLILQARSDAEVFDVGKSCGVSTWAQEDINELLIKLAHQGKRVVRLKGGDPFVFGRGGEEQAALREANCAVEIVPGVSSATGVPAALGVPLTHRGTSSDFAILTGQGTRENSQVRHNWEAMAQLDTLVILMGFQTVSLIQQGLLSAGKCAETPVLLVSAGTWLEQKVERTCLGKLVRAVQEGEWDSPSLMIIGKVVEHWSSNGSNPERSSQVAEANSKEQRVPGQYPVTLTHMESRQVLIVGGGNVGTRKSLKLLKTGAQVVLCSPAVSSVLQARIDSGEMTWIPREFSKLDLEGKFLVFAATNDSQLNREIYSLATKKNILCNVATNAAEGDFWVPALAHVKDCTVAFSSRHGQPRSAQLLRDQFEALWLFSEQD